jgi:hypothetical protein
VVTPRQASRLVLGSWRRQIAPDRVRREHLTHPLGLGAERIVTCSQAAETIRCASSRMWRRS